MNLTIKYNGADITNSIDLQSCILTDRYGGLLDSIKLVINDTDNEWTEVANGDEITIKADGYSTGAMYLARPERRDKILVIDAVSLKPSKKIVKSKIWRHVRLSEILSDCAKNNNLGLSMYDVTDYTYESVAQIQKTDIDFASEVCKREGYSVKIDNNCLIVFNEYVLESQETDLKITPDDVKDDYSFARSNGTNSVTVSCYDLTNGLIEYTAADDSVSSGSEVVNEKVTSYDEAIRFAHGYLRNCNKKNVVGHLSMDYNPKFSAGTVFYAEGFQDFDGKYVVIEVSHNIIKEKSSLIVRKILNY